MSVELGGDWGLGFGVWGLGSGVWGLEFGVQGSVFGFCGSGIRVAGLGFRETLQGCWVWSLRFGGWVLGLGSGVGGLVFDFWCYVHVVWGLEFNVEGFRV